jgi:hypothetical protein
MEKFDNQLDRLLRKPEPELEDNGFALAVLDALPKKKQRLSKESCRYWTKACAIALGSWLTLLLAHPLELAFSLTMISNNLIMLSLTTLAFFLVVATPVLVSMNSD